jgi:hypothetical protein
MLRLGRDLAWAFVVALAVAVLVAVAGADLLRILMSFLAVFAVVAVGLTYLERRRSTPHLQPAPILPPWRPIPPEQLESSEAPILDLSIGEIIESLSGDLTAFQRERKIRSEYLGRRLQVEGEIRQVSLVGRNAVAALDLGRNPNYMLGVAAEFESDSGEMLSSLRNQLVHVVGEIAELQQGSFVGRPSITWSFRLRSSELVRPDRTT